MIPEIFPSITDERIQTYIRTAQQQKHLLAEQIVQRYQRGWEVAREASEILKRFGACRVVVFGSLLDQQRIHLRSDVDLAVWELNSKYYFQAVTRLQEIEPTFAVDLVEINSSYLYIKSAIAQGIEL